MVIYTTIAGMYYGIYTYVSIAILAQVTSGNTFVHLVNISCRNELILVERIAESVW